MTDGLLRLRKPNYVPNASLPTTRPLRVISTKLLHNPKIKVTQRIMCARKTRNKVQNGKNSTNSLTFESEMESLKNDEVRAASKSHSSSRRQSDRQKNFVPELNDEIINVYYSMNLKLPESPSFTDSEKKVFKFIRRKIRNKNSAKKSRQRKKQEFETLKANNAALESTVENLKEKLHNAHKCILNAVTLLSLTFFFINDSPASDILALTSPQPADEFNRLKSDNDIFANRNFGQDKSEMFRSIAEMLHVRSVTNDDRLSFENQLGFVEKIVKSNFQFNFGIKKDENSIKVLSEKYLALAYQMITGNKPPTSYVPNIGDGLIPVSVKYNFPPLTGRQTDLYLMKNNEPFFDPNLANFQPQMDGDNMSKRNKEFNILNFVLNDEVWSSDENKDTKEMIPFKDNDFAKLANTNENTNTALNILDFDISSFDDYEKVFQDWLQTDRHSYHECPTALKSVPYLC